MTNNPITVYVNSGSSTGTCLYTTGSGAGYSLANYNTGTGATGVLWFTEHTSTGSATDNDVIFRHSIGGLSDTDVARNYARIDVTAIDVSNATEDGKYDIQIMVGGTLTSQLYVQSSTAGATTLVAAAAASTFTGSTKGTTAFTLTGGDAVLTSGHLTLTSGNITLSANASTITCTGTGTNGMLLTNLYNDTASALSGTQKDIKIMIGATPYYFTVYPTKA